MIANSTKDLRPQLTERQLAVLNGFADGLSTDEVAALLKISRNTVRHHLRLILAKLNARDRAHAVAIAMRLGILR
jgi:DNA-binding CsgD family transcriptional regulator